MKRILAFFLGALLLSGACAAAQNTETVIKLGSSITVNGEELSSDSASPVYLSLETQTHKDVPDDLKTLQNRVIVITDEGTYRFSGTISDAQIAVRAGNDDKVRLILDGVNITCRTAPAIAASSAFDARVPGEYGLTIELAEGSENLITGSHTKVPDDDETTIEYDGAIGAAVSL